MDETSVTAESCDVCGRTILAGERTHAYLTRDGEPRQVCDLCREAAEDAGWAPARLAEYRPLQRTPEARRGDRLRRAFGRARERGRRLSLPREAEAEAEEPGREHEPAPPPADRDQPAALPTQERRRTAVPQSPERRIRRALERFNESRYRRTVAGLIRSLGLPQVAAVTTAKDPAEVRVTVVWELSWYQWEVDLTGEEHAVRELAKGDEISELNEVDRQWNAHASEDGTLSFGAESRRR